jgi:DNA invertase Pin-like site-specific DNA recombinase
MALNKNLKPKSKGQELRKIAFYIRVSTEEQAQNPEGSIRNQEERLRETVKLKNFGSAFGEVAGIYIDRARSGKGTPGFNRVLALRLPV